jgi:hypothetical protein
VAITAPHRAKIWEFLRARKKFWLPPLVLMVLIVGGLFAIAHTAVFAPLIYALF